MSDKVRELCNTILWLDKGEQVEFTDDVASLPPVEQGFEKYKQRLAKVRSILKGGGQ